MPFVTECFFFVKKITRAPGLQYRTLSVLAEVYPVSMPRHWSVTAMPSPRARLCHDSQLGCLWSKTDFTMLLCCPYLALAMHPVAEPTHTPYAHMLPIPCPSHASIHPTRYSLDANTTRPSATFLSPELVTCKGLKPPHHGGNAPPPPKHEHR